MRAAAASLVDFLLQSAPGLGSRSHSPTIGFFETRDGRWVHLHGGFERLARGLGADAIAAANPGVICVEVSCWGHAGPWRTRRGWEQLAQAASAVAVVEGSAASPRLLPAAATDYTTGYLAAAGVAQALCRQAEEGGSWRVLQRVP